MGKSSTAAYVGTDESIKQDRTACISRIRCLLAELGLVFAQGPSHLQTVLSETLEDATNKLGTLARLTLQRTPSARSAECA
jgi:transposase